MMIAAQLLAGRCTSGPGPSQQQEVLSLTSSSQAPRRKTAAADRRG